MKTYFCAAVGLLASGLTASSALTYQQQISAFEPEDFAFPLGGPEAEEGALVKGLLVRGVNVVQLPALEGQGVSMAIANLGPCAMNPPHVHPRASEMLYMLEGSLRAAFVEENGGGGAVVNDLSKGDVSFIPQGLVHYQQNLECEPAAFLASFNSEDAGSVDLFTLVFDLPAEVIQALLNVDDLALSALQEELLQAPALARLECLQRCGLVDDDNLSFSYDV